MRKLKGMLITAGMLLILSGISLQVPEETQTLWEEIPDEEIHTYIQEKEQTEDMAVDGPVQEVEYAEVRQPAEELPPAAGEVIELTYDEATELKKLATAEAEGEGCEGQWLVMSVVWNRVQDPEYPSTIHEVINQYGVTKEGKKIYQFSCVADGRIETAKPSGDSGTALARLETGDVSPGIIAFEVTGTDILEKWFKFAFNYKHHNFFTKK
ncbi:MAG: cell wall hydrolase [Butyrivibrio sp.]|uniref:cell wall hydrolase n=1 Tax=Butyrivibrio sp. TaxID=28121 RepID=UPI001B669514|nr:cell wall hydrolase [Butyrivibrio sp.]MBP3782517.1 cell wall hydrolase [Butyrivibrio sp.]